MGKGIFLSEPEKSISISGAEKRRSKGERPTAIQEKEQKYATVSGSVLGNRPE